MKLAIIDAVDCRVEVATREEVQWLKALLSYHAEMFVPGQFAARRKEYQASVVTRSKKYGWIFPVGLLPRVQVAAKRNDLTLRVASKLPRLEPTDSPNVPGKTLRPDQLRLIDAAVAQQRGLLVAPTGSGKTVLLMGLLSRFPGAGVLVVTHSKSIVTQTLAELRAHCFDAAEVGCGHAPIMIGTRQALVGKDGIKEAHRELVRRLDIVVIDEVHLFGGNGGQYTTLLRSTLAPMRLGLTGTAPTDERVALALEGALGGIIGQVTYEEGRAMDVLADVKLELLTIPVRSALRDYKTYRELLQHGLVENRTRNRLIIERAKALVDEGLTVLIFINELAHGDLLAEMAELLELPAPFLEGATDNDVREGVKAQLLAGKVRCVISSKIWREGVNIPNLGAVILAGGGKAELSTLQAIGRGLRTAAGKKHAVIVDCLDPYRYLAEHTIQRMGIYVEMGWL